MKTIACALLAGIVIWAGVPAVKLQFWHMDNVTVFVPNIPTLCGIDWCPGKPI